MGSEGHTVRLNAVLHLHSLLAPTSLARLIWAQQRGVQRARRGPAKFSWVAYRLGDFYPPASRLSRRAAMRNV